MHSSRFPSRRSVLRAITAGAGAVALQPLLGFQRGPTTDTVTAQIRADLEKHASFGIKRSTTPGDLATAEWIAERLKASGYKVGSHEFPARQNLA